MFVPANTSWIISRQRRNAERVCSPPSPGFATFAAYFTLIPTTTTASTPRNSSRARVGGASGDARPDRSRRGDRVDMRRVLAARGDRPGLYAGGSGRVNPKARSRRGLDGHAERLTAAVRGGRVRAARVDLIGLQFGHLHRPDPHRGPALLVRLH